LEKQANAADDSLPRSSITAALARDALPREDLVAALVRACGCADATERWVATRRRIAGAGDRLEPAHQAVIGVGEDIEQEHRRDGELGASLLGRRAPVWWRAGRAARVTVALLVLVGVAAAIVHEAGTDRSGAVPQVPRPLAAPAGGAPVQLPWPLPNASALRRPPAAPAGAPTVLYVGDTLAVETASVVTTFVQGTGKARVVSAAHAGTALCDFLPGRTEASSVPPEQRLPVLIRTVRPQVVVLQFWGYATADTPCTGTASPGGAEYERRYRADAEEAVQEIAAAASAIGIKRPAVVWVLQGPDRYNPERVRRLNEIFTAVATAHGDWTSDAGGQISMAAYPYQTVENGRYTWAELLPCTDSERQYGLCTQRYVFGGIARIHRQVDDVGLCLGAMTGSPSSCDFPSPGLVRYGGMIAYSVVAYLG
jgi:hypothetical protein